MINDKLHATCCHSDSSLTFMRLASVAIDELIDVLQSNSKFQKVSNKYYLLC